MGDTASKLATAFDLLSLEAGRFEVLGGEIVEKAAPSFEHSDAQLGGGALLRSRFHGGGGGEGGAPGGWWIVSECEIELEPHEVFRPELVVDPEAEVLTVYRHGGSAYEVALTATREETVNAEPFEAAAPPVGVFFGFES